ncbi:hypothetical protein PybrP1_001179 [[Pythium] brassicae (nom. inval.)]|nr:hypothetical protein PybrP1_001179 [[Pythium] brassicae (nom. inval.)]
MHISTNGDSSAAPLEPPAAPRKALGVSLRIDTTGERKSPLRPRAREKRTGGGGGTGAPAVWVAPDWATYPIIENFYGQPPRSRVNSFYEVMCSPTNPVPTTTLGENCCGYDVDDGDSEGNAVGGPAAAGRARLRVDSSGVPARGHGATRRRKFGSFSYSCSTDETSDDADFLPSPFPSTSVREGFSSDAARSRRRRSAGDAVNRTSSAAPGAGSGAGSGFAAWNRIRRSVGDGRELVPVPHAGASVLPLQNPRAGLGSLRASRFGNPQAGSVEPSPTEAIEYPESPAATPPTTSRLRVKLHDSLAQIDARIERERAATKAAQAQAAKAAKQQQPPSVVWSLICGAKPSQRARSDGLAQLRDQLAVAAHTRALNQLQRHRRHVLGILQIVTSHNPDLELTEKQLDSFESADDMLGHDVKHSLLTKQVAGLAASIAARKEALIAAKAKNGPDCFEFPRVKSAMLAKLLEAGSWYRLVQTNSRAEASGASGAAAAVTPTPQGDTSGDRQDHASPMAGAPATTPRSLQEIQVERILSVLAGEDFYSDYSELMCRPDWWDVAQAHFENLIFAAPDSRVCQWMSRMSADVAAASREALEDTSSGGGGDGGQGASRRAASERRQSYSEGMRLQPPETLLGQRGQARPYWASDPQPEQILEFVDRVTRRVRRELDVPADVSKSLGVFVQRAVFPRVAVLCFGQKAVRDCQRKDKLWRKKCVELGGVDLETLSVPPELAARIRSLLPSRRSHGSHVYLLRAIEAFNGMGAIVPCDLLDELMRGVVVLHHEAARVLGTTQFSVETFFPLLAYVLLHCRLPRIHAQLHLLEHFAITAANANGEDAYYVYCVHAAVEYVCNSAALAAAAHDKQRGDASSRSASPSQASDSGGAVHPIAAASDEEAGA